MLLKTSNGDKTTYVVNSNGKGKRSMSSRIHRKTLRVPTKPAVSGKRVAIGKRISLGKNQKNISASYPPTTTSLCDNSNDSGLGFDHNESQHIIQHPTNIGNNNRHSPQNMALTTAANFNNNNNSNNKNNDHSNGTSVNCQRSLNSIRYGELSTYASAASTASFIQQNQETSPKNTSNVQFGAGKKIKIKKPFEYLPIKNNTNHLTLKNETEDTCGDDFFSTHVQKTNNNNTSNTTVSSPTSLSYSSSSPSENNSAISSPILTSPNRSSPEITNGNNNVTPENASENLGEVHLLSLSSLQNYSSISRDGSVQLQIVTQPEQQHRARYQTEGSRGAVKDKSGNGFPVVKLNGYNKPAVLQVFIGNDVGRVSPHIFYQACKVSGKNSTSCNEVKVDGTMVIEIEIKPENDMTVICDCVGILKERNVDVEHRLGKNNSLAASVTRNKKKSTKCRMIFRTKINDETTETSEILQICSNTITCTQPPGIPEICKKSLESCNSLGGKELFIIGKNFLKDTKITFVRYDENGRAAKKIWEETVLPDKEYLQQTHLICTIPQYPDEITEPIQVQIYVTSSNKKSEPHTFIYLPLKKFCCSISQSPPASSLEHALNNIAFNNVSAVNQQDLSPTSTNNNTQLQNVLSLAWNTSVDTSSTESSIMPPPQLTGISSRKASFSKTLSDPGTNDSSKIIINNSNNNNNNNNASNNSNNINTSNDLKESTTSSPIQQSGSGVKEILFNDNSILNVTGQCFMNPSTSLLNPSHVGLLDEFQVVHHIKSEQNADQQSQQNVVTSTVPVIQQQSQQPQGTELNSVQQQQVVENFLNMICAQVEPAIVQQNTENLMSHHLSQDMMLNTTPNNPTTDHAGNLMSAMQTTQPVMLCEQNILSVQLDGTNIIPIHNSLDNSISNDTTTSTSLISNAVSEAAAETQAVVKQMIASVAAEILSESPNETQINSFISTTLGTEMGQVSESEAAQAPQITSSQQQQLQEIIAQELLTPALIKKEENDGQPQNVQDALISDSSSNNPANQPFSPTPADFNLTTMSESDLISFINPSVFI